jgi:hypothetical protein
LFAQASNDAVISAIKETCERRRHRRPRDKPPQDPLLDGGAAFTGAFLLSSAHILVVQAP